MNHTAVKMETVPLKVLIVEDSEEDADLIVLELKRGGFEPIYRRVDNAEAMAKALAEREWDLVLSDFSMPHFSVTEALEHGAGDGARHSLRHRIGDHRRRGRGGGDEGRRARLHPQAPAGPAGAGGQPRAARIGGSHRAAQSGRAVAARAEAGEPRACWPAAWRTISTTC